MRKFSFLIVVVLFSNKSYSALGYKCLEKNIKTVYKLDQKLSSNCPQKLGVDDKHYWLCVQDNAGKWNKFARIASEQRNTDWLPEYEVDVNGGPLDVVSIYKDKVEFWMRNSEIGVWDCARKP